MVRSRNLLLPSILQVLEEGHYQHRHTEGISSMIIWIDFEQLDHTKYKLLSKRSQTPLSCLMKTIDLRGAEPAREGDEHFSHIVCFPEDEFVDHEEDGWDSRTMFNEVRTFTFTSAGSPSGRGQYGGFQAILSSLALRFKPSRSVDPFPLEKVSQYSP